MECNKKSHVIRTILLCFFAIILLILSSPFIYSLIGGYRDYDNIPKLIASGEVIPLSVGNDGAVSFSADKASIYSYASRIKLKDMVYDQVQQQVPFVSEKSISFKKMGYEISSDSLSASFKFKVFGIIPVQLHADADFKLSTDKLYFKLNGLKYGKWISIPIDQYASSFDFQELTEGFTVDIGDFYGELNPTNISVKDNAILIKSDILNNTIKNIGETGVVNAYLVSSILGENSDASALLKGDTLNIYSKVNDSSALSNLLTGILKLGHKEDAAELKPFLEDTPFINIAIDYTPDDSSCYSDKICDILSVYEDSLTNLRDNYKKLKYEISEAGLCNSDGSPAESDLPKDWGSKIVLQYNKDYESIVKVNDGTFSPISGWIVLPNPNISDLKHASNISMPTANILDLTLAMKFNDGTPAILFLTASDQLGINIISEDLYNEIISSKGLVVYCSSDIISSNTYTFISPDSSLRDLVLYAN